VRSTKFITITDLAFVIIPILIVTLAAFVYLRKKKNGEKHDVKNGD
jgi:LPXTG-motif cell wall-anchored protein